MRIQPGTLAGLAVVLLVYVLVHVALIRLGGGTPFVFDNNETFSNIVHATNLDRFGLSGSFGLTDEAYGPNPAAHPFAYTHQGNLPRLFAWVLVALGIDTPQGQIIATVFSAGLLTAIGAFAFLGARIGVLAASMYLVMLLTDYILYAQWSVNTWQMWHFVLFFSSVAVLGACLSAAPRVRPLLAALAVFNFAALFYYEILFAAFLAMVCAVFLLWHPVASRRRKLHAGFLMCGGLAFGAAILTLQAVLYLGLDGFLEDLRMTFFARNFADPGALSMLERFYAEKNVVFWFNVTNASEMRQPAQMLQYLLDFVATPYTPYLAMVLAMLSLMGLLGREPVATPEEGRRGQSLGILVISVAYLAFATTCVFDGSLLGLRDLYNIRIPVAARFAVALVAAGMLGLYLLRYARSARLQSRDVLLLAVLLLGFGAAIRFAHRIFSYFYSPLWRDMLTEGHVSLIGLQITMLVLGWLLIAVRLPLPVATPTGTPAPGRIALARKQRFVLTLLLGGLAGYVLVCLLIPGYLKTVYLQRFAPLTVFIHLLPAALGLSVLVEFLVRSAKRVADNIDIATERRGDDALASFRVRFPAATLLAAAGTGIGLFCLAVVFDYWLTLQKRYTEILPADHFTALYEELRKPEYAGASFAVNTYAAPAAVTSHGWAYFDEALIRNLIADTGGRPKLVRDERHLWLADRATNAAYRTPRYFLCLQYQAYYSVTYQLTAGQIHPEFSCDLQPLIKAARAADEMKKFPPPFGYRFGHVLQGRDPSGLGRWAIVRLDWEDLPNLAVVSAASDSRVLVSVEPEAGPATARRSGRRLSLKYRLEGGGPADNLRALSTLFVAEDSALGCANPDELVIDARELATSRIELPHGFSGLVQVAITPFDDKRFGQSHYSEVLEVRSTRSVCRAGVANVASRDRP